MATFDYNPITGNLDLVGSGASYINGVVADPTALPVTVGTPPLDSVYLAKSGSGVWLINRRPSGLYCRVANNGNLNDWVALGAFPEINADGNWELYNSADPTKELKFDLSAIATGNTRTISVPNKNVTLDDVSDARTPTAHNHAASAITSGVFDNARINFAAPSAIGSTTPAAVSATDLSASNRLNIPNTNGTTAGDIYRNADTLRYRDSSNTERILLSGAGNLANLTDTATARTNIGLGSASAVTFGSIQGTPIGSTTAAAITGTTGTFSTLSANNGTQTSTAFAPALTLSQTWNTSGHVFSAFTIDITNTASSSNSTFLICRAGGNSAFEFRTGGNLVVPASGAFNCSGTVVTSGQVSVNSGGSFAFTSSSTSGFSGQDTFIRRDAASILAQYNGTNAQVWRLYSTVSGTGNANFERLAITAQAADSFLISTQKGGTGSARGLILRTDDTARLTFGASGTITLNTTLAADAQNISTDTTTGTKIGTGTTQKIGFFNATPVTQRAAIADATDAATTQARLNDLLAAMRSLGLIAT